MTHRIEQEIKLSRPLDSVVREMVLNVFRTEQVLTKSLEEALAPFDLRLDEFNVLRILRGAGAEGHERRTVEERMLHPRERLLGLIHKLRLRGLIDGTIRLTITPAGLALLGRADHPFLEAIESMTRAIPEAELRASISVLERIRAAAR